MKVKDLQFPRYFLSNELDLQPDLVASLLNYDIEVHNDGEPDATVLRNDKIIYSNPSSITKFLYLILYRLLSQFAKGIGQDKLALGLLYMVRDYVYADFDEPMNIPPLCISFDKVSVPSMIVHEIIEPLLGHIPSSSILYVKNSFIDTCKTVTTQPALQKQFNLAQGELQNNDFPLVAVNRSVHNSAAQEADLLVKYLELHLGQSQTIKIIQNILLNDNNQDHILKNIVLISKMLKSNPIFVTDFMVYLESACGFTSEQKSILKEKQSKIIQADKYLSQSLKTAQSVTPQVFRQWSQWSMLMGLIEKQLSTMRGSMWPASELVKPFEDKLDQMIRSRSDETHKTQLGYEELLSVARDLYNHKAVEPGKLIEEILKDVRVWN
jgi:hypothetical protein